MDGLARGLAMLALAAGMFTAHATAAPDAPGRIRFERVFPSLTFERPTAIVAAPGDATRLYVVLQTGEIRVIEVGPDPQTTNKFLDITLRVRSQSSEEGLLGLAFAPDFATSGMFYVYYSVRLGARRTRVSRFHANSALQADSASEAVLLEIPQPFPNHKGGALQFGHDDMLYVATGDGGSADDPQNNGQNLGVLLGKILRLAPDGSIPEDNPFTGAGERREIWAYGLRNPWRMHFDRLTGKLWVGDVGQYKREEIDIVEAGGNYGWRVYEGRRSNINPDELPLSDFDGPVYQYSHAQGRCAIIGGPVYRGTEVPAAYGRYVFADYCGGNVSLLNPDTLKARVVDNVVNPTAFGEDANGEVYALSHTGRVYRMR